MDLELITKTAGTTLPQSNQQSKLTKPEVYKLGKYSRAISLVFMGGSILTSPFRSRMILSERMFPDIYREYTDFLFYLSDAFLLLTVLSWLISLIFVKRNVNLGPLFITLPLIGLTFFGFTSIFTSVDPALSVYNFSRLIVLLLMYFYLVNEDRTFNTLIISVGLMVFLQSSIGIAQVLEQGSIGLGVLGELKLNPETNGVSIVAIDGIRYLRAYGLADHPNILGGILACGMVLLMAMVARSDGRHLLILTSFFMLGSIALLYTFSRSAWLAFVLSLIFTFVILYKKDISGALRRSLTLIQATIILLLPFILTNLDLLGIRLNYRNSFTQVPQENQSIGERQLLFQAGNDIFSSHPITGIGLSAFPYALALANPEFKVDYQPAHFVLLDVAVETGIFGALFYAILLANPWFAMLITWRRINFTPALIGATGMLLVISVIGFFDYYPWLLAPGRFWQWFAWGLWAGAFQSSQIPHK